VKLNIRENRQVKIKIKLFLSNYQIPRKVYLYLIKLLSYFYCSYIQTSILKNTRIKVKSTPKSHLSVILVTKSLGPGGAERQLLNLANKLASNTRFKISIVCFNCQKFPDNFYLEKFRKNIEIINLESFKIEHKTQTPVGFRYIWSLSNKLRYSKMISIINNIKPDVIHGWLDEPALIAALAGVKTKVPKIIISTRNMNPSNFLANRVFFKGTYLALTSFSNVVFLNNSVAGSEDYERWLGLKKNSFKTIYNGYDIDSFGKFNKQPKSLSSLKARNIGTVCRFDVEKDLDFWVRIVKKLVHTHDINFTLIGDGPQLNMIKKFVKSRNLEDRVKILLPNNDVYSRISKFDIFLLTSKFEGLPNVLIEAQLMGVPVIATNVGGCSETFRNNLTGILVDKRDENVVCAEILGLFEDKSRYNSFVKNAKINSSQLFDLDKIVEDYINIYTE